MRFSDRQPWISVGTVRCNACERTTACQVNIMVGQTQPSTC